MKRFLALCPQDRQIGCRNLDFIEPKANTNNNETRVCLRVRCISDDCAGSDWRVGRVMTHSSFASILIVDDYPGWRAQVRAILAAHPEWKIISEVSDGREAVREASELQPDIVVLDIALPLLNGIEAAKMIRQKSPKSKIVFLTQDNDSDLRKAALGLGQATYVQKAKAATRLCEAVAASLEVNPTSPPGNCPLQPEWEDQSS